MSKRSARTSEKQYQLYVDFLKENDAFRAGKITSQNSEELHKLWESLTISLNSCGLGAVKSTDQWKKTFSEWKSTVRRKRRNQERMKSYEEELIELLGVAATDGFRNTKELGCGSSASVTMTAETSEKVCDEWQDLPEENELEFIFENESSDPVLKVDRDAQDLLDKPQEVTAKVADQLKKTPRRQTRSPYNTKSRLVKQYSESVAATKIALDGIASALNNVASAIDSGCDKIAEALKDKNPHKN